MAFPVLRYKSSTGSNSGASGAPFGMTAKTDVTESQTVSAVALSNTITFLAAVDLTGVADDGSDVIYVGRGIAERQLFAVTAFNPSVAACTSVTVTQAVGATAIAAGAWAIGGKRKDGKPADGTGGKSIHIEAYDWDDGWTVEYENGETFAFPSGDTESIEITGGSATNPVLVKASDPTSQTDLPLLTCDANLIPRGAGTYGILNAGAGAHVIIDGFDFKRTVGNWTGAYCIDSDAASLQVRRCRCADPGGLGVFLAHGLGSFLIEDNILDFSTSTATGALDTIRITGSRPEGSFLRNFVSLKAGNSGISYLGASYAIMVICGNVFVGGANGVDFDGPSTGNMHISQNTFYGQSLHGINTSLAFIGGGGMIIRGNIFVNCGGYGANFNSTALTSIMADYNHFYNNTSGAYSTASVAGENDTSGDPGFVDVSTPWDFTPTNTPPIEAGPNGNKGV